MCLQRGDVDTRCCCCGCRRRGAGGRWRVLTGHRAQQQVVGQRQEQFAHRRERQRAPFGGPAEAVPIAQQQVADLTAGTARQLGYVRERKARRLRRLAHQVVPGRRAQQRVFGGVSRARNPIDTLLFEKLFNVDTRRQRVGIAPGNRLRRSTVIAGRCGWTMRNTWRG